MRILNRYSPFQLFTVAWLGLLTIIMAIIVINLLRAQTTVRAALAQAAADLTEVADAHIQYTVRISQTVPISTHIAINEDIPVPVNLTVEHTITVDNEIPFQQEIEVPVNLEIDQVFPISTTIPFKDEITVPIDEVISIDEEFGVPINIPVRNS